jgi:hypothetical protein
MSELPYISLENRRIKEITIESWAGAATKISGYAGMTMELIKKKDYKPNIIVGVSSGSVIGLIRIALMIKPSLIPKLEELAKSFTLDDIFNENPLNKKGGLSIKSILRGVRGKLSLADHKQLRNTLEEFYTEEIHDKYVYGSYPDLFICSTDIDTGSYVIHNAKRLAYDEVFLHILSSSAIPVLMSPLYYRNNKVMDGGIRYSNAGWYIIYLLTKKGYNVDSHVSLYSRPQNISKEIDEALTLKKRTMFRGIMGIVGRSISIMMFQNSKFCEFTEQQMSEKHSYSLQQFFLPKILDNALDTDKEQLSELYDAGKESLGNFKIKK